MRRDVQLRYLKVAGAQHAVEAALDDAGVAGDQTLKRWRGLKKKEKASPFSCSCRPRRPTFEAICVGVPVLHVLAFMCWAS